MGAQCNGVRTNDTTKTDMLIELTYRCSSVGNTATDSGVGTASLNSFPTSESLSSTLSLSKLYTATILYSFIAEKFSSNRLELLFSFFYDVLVNNAIL